MKTPENRSISLNVTLKKSAGPNVGSDKAPQAIARQELIFQGDLLSPFLAPRGVCYDGKHLIVSDTGQNRIFIWNQLPDREFQEADIVLGQVAHNSTGRNSGGAAGACSLQYPSGIWSDGNRLIVADAWNHRVLIWLTFPTFNGQAADVVVGQKDFKSNEPNIKGIGSAPSARSLNWPYGLTVFDGKLFIADTGNRRVLVYDKIPSNHFEPADHVIGKSDFEDRDYTPEHAIWPYSVKLNRQGALAITDTQYYRTLLWPDWRDAIGHQAQIIIGQPDFESNGQNQFGLYPDAHTLNWCYDSHFYGEGILIADTGNSRILSFDKIPMTHNEKAQGLIGKPHFHVGSENAETVFGTTKNLYWPFSLSAAGKKLLVADTGNHRIVIYSMLK